LPIPKALWISAAEAARENGVSRTAQILGLEYGKLKRLAEAGTVAAKRAEKPPTFVELIGSQTGGLSECLIEMEGPHGKMRIQWKGTTVPDLAGLSRALWERGVIQITPQMRILAAIEAVDGRKGIDSLARLCQERLEIDPFSGCLFLFRRSGNVHLIVMLLIAIGRK
jgi:IS66 Orf2 like protein